MPNKRLPTVAMFSLWMNDTERGLRQRVISLLSKSYPAVRWAWIVGDSSDGTLGELQAIAEEFRPWRQIEVLECNTGIAGGTPEIARRRYAATINQWFDRLGEDVDLIVQHESDLVSPVNVIELLLNHVAAGRTHIAGWPILPVGPHQALFYDIWAYRREGVLFSNTPPFHACYRPDAPFEVDSVGSCWMFPADDIRQGARFTDEAVLGLCKTLRSWGRQIWVDPQLTIIQPRELWTSHPVAP